ncbi:MAG: hypothetical protein KA104_01345 [Candidatus Pacebacteria bacterium]|nr:hypothetical protein [Candidatus Paceibacterota bacterium]
MQRLTEEQFVLAAVIALRRPDTENVKNYGIPVEASGFAAAFREHFKKDHLSSLERLERESKIVIKRTLAGSISWYKECGKEPRYTWTIYNPAYLPPTLERAIRKKTNRSPALKKILSVAEST